jgi:hypothetical protein
MRKKKPAKKKVGKKKVGKKKPASRKKMTHRKKPIRHRKVFSKPPRVDSSAQIHQGIGITTEAGVSTTDVRDNNVTSEYGGES